MEFSSLNQKVNSLICKSSFQRFINAFQIFNLNSFSNKLYAAVSLAKSYIQSLNKSNVSTFKNFLTTMQYTVLFIKPIYKAYNIQKNNKIKEKINNTDKKNYIFALKNPVNLLTCLQNIFICTLFTTNIRNWFIYLSRPR